MPQNSIKNYFLVVLDHFFCKKGPIDLVRGLFSSLDIGTYIPLTCESVWTFWGPFGGAQIPQNCIKNNFLVVSDYFSYKNGPVDSVKGLFSSLDTGTYILPNWGPFCTFLGPFWGAPKQHENFFFLVVLDHIFLKNGPNDLVRGLFSSFDIRTYILPTYRPLFVGAQIPQNSIKKNYFWVISHYLSYKNRPNDLVKGFFSSLEVGTYILPICGPLSTFLAPFGGAQMP
jgi:hypothetical protein